MLICVSHGGHVHDGDEVEPVVRGVQLPHLAEQHHWHGTAAAL